MPKKLKRTVFFGSLAVVALVAALWSRDVFTYVSRGEDLPPVVEFTWTPLGRVSLAEMKGLVRITDDHGIDFTSYRFRIVELDRTLDLPIEGMIGREYEQPISLSLIADNAILNNKKEVTIEITVADDTGQETTHTKVVKLK